MWGKAKRLKNNVVRRIEYEEAFVCLYNFDSFYAFYSADYFRLRNDGDKRCAKGGANQRGCEDKGLSEK